MEKKSSKVEEVECLAFCTGCGEGGSVWLPYTLARKYKEKRKPFKFDRWDCDCGATLFVITKVDLELNIPGKENKKEALKSKAFGYAPDNYKEL